MSNNKQINTRIQHKHDIESNWNKALSFIPKIGELIIYDADENYNYSRFKIGDGIRTINDLEFLLDTRYISHDSNTLSQLLEQYALNIDNKQDKITGTNGQVVGFDENGNAIAQEVGNLLPEGTPWIDRRNSVEILPTSTIPIDFDNGGIGIITSPIGLIVGEIYTIIYNDQTYECVAFMAHDTPCIGNLWILNEDEYDTGEPFVILQTPDEFIEEYGYGELHAIDESTEITISITGGIIYNKLPESLMPNVKTHFVKATANGAMRHVSSDLEDDTYTVGEYAFAEGTNTKAAGYASHAEGSDNGAYGDYSHAEGWGTRASGKKSHTEGENTKASGESSHAEGSFTKATGENSHAEGCWVTSYGKYSHAEGNETIAYGNCSHSEGDYTIAAGISSHAEGRSYEGSSSQSFISVIITGDAETKTYILSIENPNIQVGQIIRYNNNYAKIIAYDSTLPSITVDVTLCNESINEDYASIYRFGAIADYSHAEGDFTYASGYAAHAEGHETKAFADYSHTEGVYTKAYGIRSHAEGYRTEASGENSHTEGGNTKASGESSHAEGSGAEASGNYSHAEGVGTKSSGYASHAEGYNTKATGENSHAEGEYTIASGNYSHSEGVYTTSNSKSQHVQGEWNILDIENKDARGTYAHIIGNGTSYGFRSNAHTLDWDGNAWFAGDVYVGSTSGINKDEGSKKLITESELEEAIDSIQVANIPDIVYIGDTQPTDENTEIWINTSENWNDNIQNNVVLYEAQTLTNAQKVQARTNIGAASVEDITQLNNELSAHRTTDYNQLENRPVYSEVFIGDVLPETKAKIDPETREATFVEPLGLLAGKEYTVRWNGTDYVCTAVNLDPGLGFVLCVLGNVGMMTGGDPTDEPFVIAAVDENIAHQEGMGFSIVALDGSETVVFSIRGETKRIRKLESKYLPVGSPYIEPFDDVLLEETVLAEALAPNEENAPIYNLPMDTPTPGHIYNIQFDGVSYPVKAHSIEGHILLGSHHVGSMYFAGMPYSEVPFTMQFLPSDLAEAYGGNVFLMLEDGFEPEKIAVVGGKAVQPIPSDCLPAAAVPMILTLEVTPSERSDSYYLGDQNFADVYAAVNRKQPLWVYVKIGGYNYGGPVSTCIIPNQHALEFGFSMGDRFHRFNWSINNGIITRTEYRMTSTVIYPA